MFHWTYNGQKAFVICYSQIHCWWLIPLERKKKHVLAFHYFLTILLFLSFSWKCISKPYETGLIIEMRSINSSCPRHRWKWLQMFGKVYNIIDNERSNRMVTKCHSITLHNGDARNFTVNYFVCTHETAIKLMNGVSAGGFFSYRRSGFIKFYSRLIMLKVAIQFLLHLQCNNVCKESDDFCEIVKARLQVLFWNRFWK